MLPFTMTGTGRNLTYCFRYSQAAASSMGYAGSRSATMSVPGSRSSVARSRSIQSWPILRSSRLATLMNVISESICRVSTRSVVQTPKFAIAPIPNVPITPERCASSDFFPLDPAVQKLSLSTSSVMPMPSSRTVKRPASTVILTLRFAMGSSCAVQRMRIAS